MVHISCELFLACVFVSSRDAPTLAITTTDLKPSGYPFHSARVNNLLDNMDCIVTKGYR